MQGLVRKGHGQAQDAHVAFEAAAERIDKQLRRYMRRLKDKSSPSQPSATLDEIQANASRSEEHTSELQSLMRISYAVFCLKKKKNILIKKKLSSLSKQKSNLDTIYEQKRLKVKLQYISKSGRVSDVYEDL